MVDVPNAKYNDAVDADGKLFLTFEINMSFHDAIMGILGKAIAKTNRFVSLRIDIPHKPKSTGPHSQNAHAFGHARQIAGFQGDNVEATLYWLCVRAESKGYPVKWDALGVAHPKRWSQANSQEASLVVDQAHEDAHFLGMTLIERNAEEPEKIDPEMWKDGIKAGKE